MAKNDLGIGLGDSLGGDVLIDTDTGKIIQNDSDIMDNNPQNNQEQKPVKKDEEDLIEIPDKSVEDNDTTSSGKDSDNSSSLPYFKVLVNALHEKGILSELDEKELEELDEDESEKLFELINKEIEKNTQTKLEEKIKSLPPKIKELIGEGGEVAKAAEDIVTIRETIETLKAIDDDKIEDDEDLQKNLVRSALKNRGYSDEKINTRVAQFENLGVLEDEAKDAIKEILASAEKDEERVIKDAKDREKEMEKSREDSLKSIKKDIFDSDHIIDGMKLTEKEKQVLFDSMTKVVDKDSAGNPLNSVMVTRSKNPLAFEKALHYYHALGLFNIDEDGNFTPDLSKIKSSAKKSAVDELSNVLKTTQRNQPGRPARENKMDRAKLKERINNMKNALPL